MKNRRPWLVNAQSARSVCEPLAGRRAGGIATGQLYVSLTATPGALPAAGAANRVPAIRHPRAGGGLICPRCRCPASRGKTDTHVYACARSRACPMLNEPCLNWISRVCSRAREAAFPVGSPACARDGSSAAMVSYDNLAPVVPHPVNAASRARTPSIVEHQHELFRAERVRNALG